METNKKNNNNKKIEFLNDAMNIKTLLESVLSARRKVETHEAIVWLQHRIVHCKIRGGTCAA